MLNEKSNRNAEDSDIYRELQQHLDKMPVGFPPTKSGVELRLLKHFFTPEEAKIATKLNFAWAEDYEPLKSIYERVKDMGLSIEELEKILDTMVKKGTIMSKEEDGKKFYANAMFAIGIYELQLNNINKTWLRDFSQFMKEGYSMEFFGTKISQFRTIPVEQSLTPEHYAPSYEEVSKIIENTQGPIAVARCMCRKVTDMFNHPCKHTNLRETCLIFNEFAQHYIDQELGRVITKEEAFKILEDVKKDGLVLNAGNSQEPSFICCCCNDCCMFLVGMNLLSRPTKFHATNYYAEIDPNMCTGCGTCVDRCQLNAIKLVDHISKVVQKRCIGCGNCVITCPVEAIQLRKKKKSIIPPETEDQLYANILEKKKELKGKN
ncbi:MAG: 4Fe-4S dicluster domain-containing protein [Promethearchaeota archaeon]|nr:MAG: 4Fe-4S dicluster domain-containing protein [Candidatus Lokiarchaeota archaeon]